MASPSPLDGLRVVDLSRALSGPLCAMLLGDLGADVIKVEEPGTGDDSRHWGPPFQNGESAYFLSCNRNKRGITLNLKREGGREALWRLIERADVLIENFRPGLMETLGFGYEAVHARNPRLVYCSISAYGQDGPEATRPGYDIIMQGTTGATSVTGDPNGDPYRSGLPVCDVISGLMASQSILGALLARERSGQGQRVEATLLGATVAALGNFASSYLVSGVAPRRVGNSHPQIAPYDLLRAADGYINIAGGNDGIFRRLCAALDLPALADDPRFAANASRVANRAALLAALEARTSQTPVDILLATLEAAKVPAGPIRDMGQVLNSPQAQHIGLVREIEHPTTGAVRMVDTPLRLSDTPATLRLPPPTLGQHTAEVLRELGYDDATIAAWRADGVAI
ncbi:MAG TPA: CoA transferase [Ktedonobacterales bacterium]|nr:CoA transferase [Ktedonobacterales bacterium]